MTQVMMNKPQRKVIYPPGNDHISTLKVAGKMDFPLP